MLSVTHIAINSLQKKLTHFTSCAHTELQVSITRTIIINYTGVIDKNIYNLESHWLIKLKLCLLYEVLVFRLSLKAAPNNKLYPGGGTLTPCDRLVISVKQLPLSSKGRSTHIRRKYKIK